MNVYISDDGTTYTIVPLDGDREIWDGAYTVTDRSEIPEGATLCFSE